jgi:hypothetical protein
LNFVDTTAGASIIGLIVTLEAWWSRRGTHRLTRQLPADPQQTLHAIDAHAHERPQEGMREITPLSRSLTRLTWTVNLWGAAITIRHCSGGRACR